MKTLAILATLVATAALWLVPAQAQTPEATYQQQIFASTNQQREKRDRVGFRHQACVQRYAVRQAKRMARQQRMFHQDLGRVLRECGLSRAGENVAYGYPSGRVLVNQGWMRSAGHRRNILNRDFRLLGTGAARSADGTWYAVQVFGRR
ncbi:CAP domain-containing protein [Nocardioides hungaricus]